MCGCDDMLKFKINPTGNCDNDGVEFPAVFVNCDNCSSLTNLNEIIKESE